MSRLQSAWRNLSERARDTMLAVFSGLVALAPRLPGLDVFLTADEPKSWFGRSIMFLDALARADWAATFDSPAPGVTTMWAGSTGLLLAYARQGFPGSLADFLAALPFDPLDPAILPLVRLPIVLTAVLTAVLTYLWGKSFLGRPAAFLAALFIALDPFLLALSRILGHDALVAMFMWLSLLAFLRAVSYQRSAIHNSQFTIHNSQLFIVVSGAFGGLAFLSKYPSLSLGAFIAVVMLILHLRADRPWSKRWLAWVIDLALWSLSAGVICIILWPVTWVDPLGTVQAVLGDAFRAAGSPHQKGSFFLGRPAPDPGATFYLLVALFKTTPALWLGWLLAIFGFISAWRSKKAVSGQRSAVSHSLALALTITIAFALFYGLLVTAGGKKQDRYILPSFPALIVLAAFGYTQLVARTGRNRWRQPLLALPIMAIIFQAASVLPHSPYYFTYYNPLMGGQGGAAKTMIVGWGEGMDLAARWLNTLPDAEAIDVVAWYSTTFEPYFNGNAIYKIDEEKISRTPKPGLAADYVVFYINQIQRELPTAGALQFFQAEAPAHVVSLNGGDYAWVYPSIGLQRIIEDEARLVGQAELMGFNLKDEAGQPLESLSVDQVAIVDLYWEWRGKAPDEPIGLSLVDESGHIWGWGNPLGMQARYPFEAWQEGMVARNEFALVLQPGTPPGDYFLNAWIDRPSTGEVVGVFPLNHNDVRITVSRPDSPPPVAELGLPREINAPLAEGVTLVGASGPETWADLWQPNESRDLTFFWRADQTLTEDFIVRLSLEDAMSKAWTSWEGQPVGGRFPGNRWQRGDIVRDPWSLSLPATVPPGDYNLVVGLGDSETLTLGMVQVGGRPRNFDLPNIDLPLEARFGPSIELAGLQGPLEGEAIRVSPGQSLSLAPVWRSLGPIDSDYAVTLQLLDGQNQVRAQRDSAPLNGAAPTTTWAEGEVLVDPISLDIPAGIGPGPHRLLVALYRPDSGQRLLLANGADHVEISVK